ncbi:MAG: hypothetical protein MHPSP_002835, partial [Paramarteilia canceri]
MQQILDSDDKLSYEPDSGDDSKYQIISGETDFDSSFPEDLSAPSITSKDGIYSFTSEVPKRGGRNCTENIFKKNHRPPKEVLQRVYSSFSTQKEFLSEESVKYIISFTNRSIESNTSLTFRLSINEFWLWTAALYYIRIMMGKNALLEELWNKETGFLFLSKRRDEKTTMMLVKEITHEYRKNTSCRNGRIKEPKIEFKSQDAVYALENCTVKLLLD